MGVNEAVRVVEAITGVKGNKSVIKTVIPAVTSHFLLLQRAEGRHSSQGTGIQGLQWRTTWREGNTLLPERQREEGASGRVFLCGGRRREWM